VEIKSSASMDAPRAFVKELKRRHLTLFQILILQIQIVLILQSPFDAGVLTVKCPEI